MSYFFGCCTISVWNFMLCEPYEISCDSLMSFLNEIALCRRFTYEMSYFSSEMSYFEWRLRDFLMRCHAFEPEWYLLMRVHALCCIICLWEFLMRCRAFLKVHINLVLRDCLIWDVLLGEPYELLVDVIFWRGLFRLLFLRVDCECNRASFLGVR